MTSALPIFEYLKDIENGKLVEIGVDKGFNMRNMLDSLPNFDRFYGIDPWIHNAVRKWGEDHKKMALDRLGPDIGKRLVLIEEPSVKGALNFGDGTIDFVFIDGNHDYDFVLEDIKVWLPKVKPGGFIGGHDFKKGEPGVQTAVEEIFGTDYEFLHPDVWLKEVK